MRPQTSKPRTRKPSTTKTSNMFESLSEDDDESSESDTRGPQGTRKAPRRVRVNRNEEILSVDFNKQHEIGSVAHVDGDWERIPVKIDSGAIDTVMPPSVARYFDIVQTEMSQKGPGLERQTGHQLNILGRKR